MASTTEAAVSRKTETVVKFEPAAIKAPFLLRCAALFIDYILLVSLPVLWLVWGRLISDTAPPGGLVWFLAIVLWIVDFMLLPLLRGQTLGKMLTGLTVLHSDGSAITLGTIIKRNILGYLITIATLGVGFLAAAFNSSGRSLHDVVAGTLVVQGRKRPV
jgi:Mce-associated membrane protein